MGRYVNFSDRGMHSFPDWVAQVERRLKAVQDAVAYGKYIDTGPSSASSAATDTQLAQLRGEVARLRARVEQLENRHTGGSGG